MLLSELHSWGSAVLPHVQCCTCGQAESVRTLMSERLTDGTDRCSQTYWAMNEVARDLEDCFLYEPNDLPLARLQVRASAL